MKHTRIFSLLTACVLCLSLTACQPQETDSSETALISSVPSMPEAPAFSPTEVTSTSEPVLTPTPPPSSQTFEEIWKNNPIRTSLDEELDMAPSFSAIQQAYLTNMAYWQKLIEIAFNDCLTVLPESEQEQLKAEQAQWEQEMAEKSQTIFDDYPATDEGVMSATEVLANLFEEHARTLCEIKYNADGVMPSFEDAMKEFEPAG